MNKANFKYNAFISYSQDPDKKLAREMEDRLEKFGIGWHRLKKQQLYIFRDATDLSLTHDLGAKIKEGLEQSEFLILLAQKKLSLSALNWVNQEVGYFLKLCEQRQVDPSDYIILVITDGEIEWDRKENNWNFEKTNVLPNALQNIYVAQPLYVDLRILKDSISYGIQKQALNEALVVIEARLLKKKPSEIQDMVIRLQQIVIAFTFVVAAVLLGLAIFSFIQKNKASENEKKAKHNQQIADREKKKAMNQSIIALHESTKAIYASIETRNEARKAEKERNNAKAEKDTADQQRDTANKRKKEAIDAKNLAIVQKGKADTAKYQTDTLNKLLEAENLSIIYANLVSKVNRKDRKIMKDDTDSILLAYELFNSYFNRNRKDHYRKIESIYTALHQAYIINENTERTFPVNYSHLFIAENNNVYLLNRSGNILQLSLSLMQSNKNLEGF
ncbi:MAG TPA: TIR domain-containing protein, partial [Bacteroidales bacterium]